MMSGCAEKVGGRFPRLFSWMRYLKGKVMEDEPTMPQSEHEGTLVESVFGGQVGRAKPGSVLGKGA